jgi:NADH:ubiquinone oxidoreductase subunit 2 (subunit N)
MVIGTFAVVTYVGRAGDTGHDITAYRGLAARQPMLAFAFAVLLLAQAGAPFTTGFLAKLQVVVAAVDADSIPLAVVAMASAAIAAFFYLRVAVLMYSGTRSGAVDADRRPADAAGTASPALDVAGSGVGNRAGGATGSDGPSALWAGSERSVAVVTRLNAELLLQDDQGGPDAGPTNGEDLAADDPESAESEADDPGAGDRRVVVPTLATVGIAICVAVTVVFGVIPGPLVDFAHRAVLLFLP